MADFDFLLQYILPSEKESKNALYSNYKHKFFPLSKFEIIKIESSIKIPSELKQFYLSIGYVFFHRETGFSFRILNPYEFQQINLKLDFYEFDPALEIYESLYQGDKLLFFELVDGTYLAIDKESKNNKNAIYYFDEKISESLEGFLSRFDKEGSYFEHEE